MTVYMIRRVLIGIPLLLAVSVVVFILAAAMPGDAVTAMISPNSPLSEELIAIRQGQLGLDQPLFIQYFSWLGQLARGNLGFSYISGDSVTSAIGSRLGATLLLMGLSLAFSIVVGVSLGIVSAMRRYSRTDYLLTVGGFIGLSVPVFFLGLVLVYIFALRLDLFPTSGIGPAGEPRTLSTTLRYVALPAAALGFLRIALFMRYTRSSVLESMNAPWVRTARSKGLPERRVASWHIIRNSLVPIVTVIGLALPLLVSGAVIIEKIFQWPGIGLLFLTAIEQRDAPVLMGVVMVAAVVVVIRNLLTDAAYAAIDPRVRYD